jgi:hypothetical protein
MQEHEAKDLVLRFLIDNHFEKFIHCSEIKKSLFDEQDELIVNTIFIQLVNAGESVVKTQLRSNSLSYFDGFFKATSLTKLYLENQGGFTSEHEEYLSRKEKENKREKLEIDLAKSNIEANTLNIENASKNKWFTWINIAIGVLNLVLLAIQILTD